VELRHAHSGRWQYPEIFNTFVEACADYPVSMSDLTRERLQSRRRATRVAPVTALRVE
jgi:hypothetical protein